MSDDMEDAEFLSYCDAHASSPRCGFVPEHIARLLRLGGNEEDAAKWDKQPVQVVECNPSQIRAYVIVARERAAT
jgi:hypothetical protein